MKKLMETERLHDRLIQEIRNKIPKNSLLVNKLSDLLCIEKEAVYRRLRKEVPFSFSEVAEISKELLISLDNLVGINDERKRSAFQLQMTEFIKPQETDYIMMDEYVEVYRRAKNDKTSEMATSSNIIPQTIFAGFPAVRHFYLFKWNYHYEMNEKVKTFHDLIIPEKVIQSYEENFIAAKNIARAYHILDQQLFQYIVNDILFFHSIDLIKKEDVLKIKKELLNLLEYLENLARTGIYEETKNEVYFYVSDLNIDSNYFYLDTNLIKISLLSAFILSSASSSDEKTLAQLKNWVQSIIRISNLITVTGEKHRSLFFNSQRKIVDLL